MTYGVGYVGSKNTIAADVVNILPKGERLVDLFGGGGAITHCATLSNKWNTVVYNDYDKVVVEAISNAIHGAYSFDNPNFHPTFITREQFKAEKNINGYIKIAWSFSNNGIDYIFAKNKERLKKVLWDYVVLGESNDVLLQLFPLLDLINETKIEARKEQFHYYTRMFAKNHYEDDILTMDYSKYHNDALIEAQQYFASLNPHGKIQDLFRLQPLNCLKRFNNLTALRPYYDNNQLIITCDDYRNYHHKDGDIVYCDIPYEQTISKMNKYNKWFDYQKFYDWALMQPYDVYFSSYYDTKLLEFADILWEKRKVVKINADTNNKHQLECLYKIKR